MKLSAIISAALVVAASAVAAPVTERQTGDSSDKPLYRLRVCAPESKDLHGMYLSLSNGSVGVHNGGGVGGALRVSAVGGQAPGLFELHTFPVGIVDHALSLVGSNGMLDLVDVVAPAGRIFPNGTAYDWRAFTMGPVDPTTDVPEANSTLVSYGSVSTVDQWTAWPGPEDGDWDVRWWGDTGFSIEVYQRIDIIYEKFNATDGRASS